MSFLKIRRFVVAATAATAVLIGLPGVLGGTKLPKSIWPYQDSTLPVETRVKDLLSRMTLEEKVAQVECSMKDIEAPGALSPDGLGGLACVLRGDGPQAGAEKANRIQKLALGKTRLGIPIIIHDEALHGILARGGTSFPQAIALAATWNPELMERVAQVIGRETRTRGIRQVLSPVVNIARDVRWGRTEETYGEDPFLTSAMSEAFCHGVEGQGVITTPKHYAANVGDGGRDSNAIHFSERLLREVYFPGFKACFQRGGAQSVMAAYNSIDGIPCSANDWLLTDVLRKEWGFQGFVVSDYGSVAGIWNMHHTAATEKEAAAQALEAGLDMELPEIFIYGQPLRQALREGLVSETVLDRAVSRILTAKFRLGLFDQPYVDPAEAARANDSAEHRALALEAARQSIVLLKNENGTLPLKKDIKTIALLGPCADAERLGGYSGFGIKVVSILEGLKDRLAEGTKVVFAEGCKLESSPLPIIPAAFLRPSDATPEAQGLKGEYFNNKDLSGAPAVVRIDPGINFDWANGAPDPKIDPDNFSVRWTGRLLPEKTNDYLLSVTTDDGVRLSLDGKLLLDQWVPRGATTDYVPVRLEAGRAYDLRIEYYENGGYACAFLGWNVEPKEDVLFQQAVDAARSADAAVVVTGLVEGEGRDRARLSLPGKQEALIKAVAETGVPTVVVLTGGSAATMEAWEGRVPAIVEAWYPGEEGGHAVADILLGRMNPAGRLPITFPRFEGQVPLYNNPRPTGRGYDYVDMSGRPSYPFGYGLSYTNFEYSDLKVDPQTIAPDGTVSVSVAVKNTGERAGEEVIQLYLHDMVSSVSRPIRELRGFQRISLELGETKIVRFALGTEDLAFLDKNLKTVIEPGTFEIMIGASSEDIKARASFEVVR
jgi:beta-glucosidase